MMKDKELIVVYKEVDKEPVPMKIIDSIKSIEELVGGKISIIPFDDIFICCNEEYQRKVIRPNITYKFGSICGNFFVTNKDEKTGELINLTKEQAKDKYFYLKKHSFNYKNFDENGRLLTKFERKNKRKLEELNAISKKESFQKSPNQMKFNSNIDIPINNNIKNSFKTNENQKIIEKNPNTDNLQNNIQNEIKNDSEANNYLSYIEKNNKEIIKLLLGIKIMIESYLNKIIQ